MGFEIVRMGAKNRRHAPSLCASPSESTQNPPLWFLEWVVHAGFGHRAQAVDKGLRLVGLGVRYLQHLLPRHRVREGAHGGRLAPLAAYNIERDAGGGLSHGIGIHSGPAAELAGQGLHAVARHRGAAGS